MEKNKSCIGVFHHAAGMNILFQSGFEHELDFIERTESKKSAEEFIKRKKEASFEREYPFTTYIYHQPTPRSPEEVYTFLKRSQKVTLIYRTAPFCTGSKTGYKLGFYWDVNDGMYIILAETTREGMIEDIYVRVYNCCTTFLQDITSLYEEVNRCDLLVCQEEVNYVRLIEKFISE